MDYLSAYQLNNHGVMLLEASNHKKAAACFKNASKVMRDSVMLLQLDNPSGPQNQSISNPLINEGQDKFLEKDSSSIPLVFLRPSLSYPSPRSMSAARPSKRQKKSQDNTVTVGKPTTLALLGNALWMKPAANDPISQSATIIYNLGLSLHREGQHLQALRIYEMAKSLALKCTPDHFHVLLVCLHNLKELYQETKNEVMYTKTHSEVITLLRFFVDSYETFYLTLLSVHSRNNAAAA